MPEQKKSPAVLRDSSLNLSEGNSALCCTLPPHSFPLGQCHLYLDCYFSMCAGHTPLAYRTVIHTFPMTKKVIKKRAGVVEWKRERSFHSKTPSVKCRSDRMLLLL